MHQATISQDLYWPGSLATPPNIANAIARLMSWWP